MAWLFIIIISVLVPWMCGDQYMACLITVVVSVPWIWGNWGAHSVSVHYYYFSLLDVWWSGIKRECSLLLFQFIGCVVIGYMACVSIVFVKFLGCVVIEYMLCVFIVFISVPWMCGDRVYGVHVHCYCFSSFDVRWSGRWRECSLFLFQFLRCVVIGYIAWVFIIIIAFSWMCGDRVYGVGVHCFYFSSLDVWWSSIWCVCSLFLLSFLDVWWSGI